MNLQLHLELAAAYRSAAQMARVVTEAWVAEQMYCPRCGAEKLCHAANNRPAEDFVCPSCKSSYELKSKRGAVGHKLANGAYEALLQRIRSNNNPDLLVLTYDCLEGYVRNLWVIPKTFFVPSLIEKRPPLSAGARRAGWVGSNILFSVIPPQGKICVLNEGQQEEKGQVLTNMRQASGMMPAALKARGWVLDMLACLEKIPAEMFSLEDVYRFEPWFSARHPRNRNIRPKIRQQLQRLRDYGVLEFIGAGCYRKAAANNRAAVE